MISPSSFIPLVPGDFIGPAHRLATVLERKASAMLDNGQCAKILIHGSPGTGKTALANMFAVLLATHHTQIERVNGRNVGIETVRRWVDSAAYRVSGWTVKLINELDTIPTAAQDASLDYLDALPGHHVVIATANCALGGLSERFQTRFQAFKLNIPSADEVAALLSRFGLNGDAARIGQTCKGNVRAALLDAQSILDCK